jgi:hypothetical protein
VNEAGTVAKDDNGDDLKDKAVTISGNNKYIEFKFHEDTTAGFYRAYWAAWDDDNKRLELESRNDPEGFRVEILGTYSREIVSPAYLRNNFFFNIPLHGYTDDSLRDILQASRGEVENELQLFLAPTEIVDEKHDYYFEEFVHTYWLHHFFHWPVISIERWEILYNDVSILDLDPPGNYIALHKEMGTCELIPLAAGTSGWLYTMLFSGLSALGVSIFAGFERIPLFFHFDYTAGLDWDNLPAHEKANIRHGVARRAAINLLQKLDTEMGISSRTVSMDGVSESVSLTSSAMYGQYSAQITQYLKDDEGWIERMRRRYMKNAPIAVA